MESPELVAAKRRVLIDALMTCLGKSRVVEVVDARTVRSVIESASGEMWRQGEFRLDPLWKLLVAQPGLTAEDVAPPLLVFKAYESELGVVVRTPQALSAIPRGEQVRLRDALGMQRDDLQRAFDEIRALAAGEGAPPPAAAARPDRAGDKARPAADKARPSGDKARPSGDKARAAADRPGPRDRARPAARETADRRALAIGLGLAAVVAVAASSWLALRNRVAAFDVSDVAGTLQLTDARAGDGSLTATIADARWAGMSRAQRRQTASALFDVESAKGIKVLTLRDASGATRAMVTDSPDGRSVILP